MPTPKKPKGRVSENTPAHRLLIARLAAGEHNRAALARELGLDPLALYRFEAGRTQQLQQKTLDPICKRLGITPAWLYHGEGDGPAAPSPDDELRSRWADVVERYLADEGKQTHPATAERLRALDWLSGGFRKPRVSVIRHIRIVIDEDEGVIEHTADEDSE